MEKFSLNDLYLKYSGGNINRAELESAVYTYFFFNKKKTCLSHWKNEDFEDYISWFYPRLIKAIDSYNEKGSSFEAYIGKFLLISSKEYRVRLVTQSVTERSAWNARLPDSYAYEEHPSYSHEKKENALSGVMLKGNCIKNTRCILALVLKCYYYVSEDFIEKIAPMIKVDINELHQMLEKIQKIRRKKDDKIYLMKERIYSQYYRCVVFEKRLSVIQENTITYAKLKIRLEKARQRLERMRKRIASIRTDATNKQVADVIGIKKGTVDASLYKLKNRLNIMAGKAGLN